jgi:coenzyme Q-binding protein COQ10
MTKFSEVKIINHSASDIYQLVMDIEKYPEFLPWCKKAKIIEIKNSENLVAELTINFKGFLESYTSDVVHKESSPNQFLVEVIAIKGPFKKLKNNWKISAVSEQQSRIEFFIDFEFNSFLLNKIISVIFEKAAQKMISAFEQRAADLKLIKKSS